MNHVIPCCLLFICLFGCTPESPRSYELTNEAEDIRVHIGLTDSAQAFFQVFHEEDLVLDTSYLGLTTENARFEKDLTLGSLYGPTPISDSYQLLHGKQREFHYQAQQYTIQYTNKDGLLLECHFHLSRDGVAFRYLLPKGDTLNVVKEASSFGFPEGTKAWMQPMSEAKTGWSETNPSYEEHYQMEVPVSHPSPIGEGYVYPALFQTGQNWVLVSETDLHRRYSGTRLTFDETIQQLRVTMPQPEEIFPGGGLLPTGVAPLATPWRTIAIGSLEEIVENTLGTDLAAPAIDMDTDFIEPGLASWSWILLKDNFINYETSLRFIDYASEMNWKYCLIDVDWDQKIGYDRMQELIDYAAGQDVGIILWYNSSGSWNSTPYTPKSKLVDPAGRRAEFSRLRDMGVSGIKVDFFGGDGQSMIAYYHDILQDAADYQLMLNFHGATLPRGWQRTYPHLMTVEAIKGEEFVTFDQGNADRQPAHCALLPFTRNVYDPMDFTPMVLDSIPGIKRRTTAAFELALPFLFTSGIQHMAEKPGGMARMPDYVIDLLRDVPTQWEELRFLSGYPGKEVVLARRAGDRWFIAGINGEASAKTISIDLSFLEDQRGSLYTDGDETAATIVQKEVIAGRMEVYLPPNGGIVMIF